MRDRGGTGSSVWYKCVHFENFHKEMGASEGICRVWMSILSQNTSYKVIGSANQFINQRFLRYLFHTIKLNTSNDCTFYWFCDKIKSIDKNISKKYAKIFILRVKEHNDGHQRYFTRKFRKILH